MTGRSIRVGRIAGIPVGIRPTLNRSYVMPALDEATVADAMHPGIITCDPDAPLADVARSMAANRVHCIAVMGISHREPEELVWGIITDLELIKAGVSASRMLTARDVAVDPAITVQSTHPLREAAAVMLDHRVSHLVVISTERVLPVGILSTLDVARALAGG
jgi:CBS domain-containing protein